MFFAFSDPDAYLFVSKPFAFIKSEQTEKTHLSLVSLFIKYLIFWVRRAGHGGHSEANPGEADPAGGPSHQGGGRGQLIEAGLRRA